MLQFTAPNSECENTPVWRRQKCYSIFLEQMSPGRRKNFSLRGSRYGRSTIHVYVICTARRFKTQRIKFVNENLKRTGCEFAPWELHKLFNQRATRSQMLPRRTSVPFAILVIEISIGQRLRRPRSFFENVPAGCAKNQDENLTLWNGSIEEKLSSNYTNT